MNVNTSVDLEDIKNQIILLKRQMYKLENEADLLQMKVTKSTRNNFSKSMIFVDDYDIEKQAREKRSEALNIKRKIHKLQSELR